MKELVEFALDDDSGSVYVEVESSGSSDTYTRVSAQPGETAGRAAVTFQRALDPLRPAVGAVLEKLTNLAVPPEEVQLEFSVKLTGKAGAVFAASSAEGQFKVAVTWRRNLRSPVAGESEDPGAADGDESA
ncbi:CU044_2847 family protein [Streptomyces pseudovenezuelae]|uniref:CU044_2847 family protein n=1 Tax=Streptomyces pseudovenezuelae TaxID=67350 RepID=UPI002473B2C9|nr:CU044_2847 family protein [Streptomyces pseudovenezuelae]